MQTTGESRSKGFFRSSPSTAFDQYLQDIQKLPLITDAEEERRLARRAQAGDEKAAERLVTANLRFVISYVKKYQGHGLDLGELVAIGNEGLLKAVRKFDPDQGVKFISYAVWWVRQAVLKALAEQTRSVRIPLNQNSQLIKLARAQTVLSQVLKRDPTDNEIGRLLEETPDAVRSAKQMSATEISLDAPIDRSDREACTLACGQILCGPRDQVELVEPRQRMSVGLLHDHDVGPMRLEPAAHVLPCDGEPVVFRHAAQTEHAAGHNATTANHGVAEIAKSGIEGEDGVSSVAHGV